LLLVCILRVFGFGIVVFGSVFFLRFKFFPPFFPLFKSNLSFFFRIAKDLLLVEEIELEHAFDFSCVSFSLLLLHLLGLLLKIVEFTLLLLVGSLAQIFVNREDHVEFEQICILVILRLEFVHSRNCSTAVLI